MGTRTLVLLRHGKSDYPGGVRDHDRPLAPRGRREAALAGALLAARRPPIDAVLCSTALRTRQTLRATGIGAPVQFADEIYDASPGGILQRIAAFAAADTDVRCLLVVGHSPGMPGTALTLADHGPEQAAGDRLADLRSRFPTSAYAVLAVPGRWDELTATGAELVDFVIPRD